MGLQHHPVSQWGGALQEVGLVPASPPSPAVAKLGIGPTARERYLAGSSRLMTVRMRSPTESRTEQSPSRTPQPVNDNRDGGLPEPASWYLSSWELRVGLTIIEHDDIATVPGDLSE